ncbi:transglutaminase N-terminal domain-containing protein [Stella sp.]|uniref:transglutaminase family protein n=1 Tax=Stella sp. TaxID=2912054 RepID=UPI0035B140FD
MTEYSVRHRTIYRYLQPVAQSQHLLHLAPRPTARQSVVDCAVRVTPEPTRRVERLDAFGNRAEWLALEDPHTTLEILAESRVVEAALPAPDPAGSWPWEAVRRRLEAALDVAEREAVDFLFDSPLVRPSTDLSAYALASFPPGRPVLAGAIDLMGRIHADFRYDTTVTDATTPVDRVFAIRAGVCQDLAHVGIACLRAIGLPARYVSGYLLTSPPPGMPRLVGADASHAWFAAWCPPFGWVDLDPTNDVLPGTGHVTVAWGRDYGDVAPINGVVVGGRDHTIEVAVDVAPPA